MPRPLYCEATESTAAGELRTPIPSQPAMNYNGLGMFAEVVQSLQETAAFAANHKAGGLTTSGQVRSAEDRGGA